MLPDDWGRIGAIEVSKNGNCAAVWIAYDRDTDTIHVYDSCLFRNEVWPVIAEGLNARGRKVPVAWKKEDKSFADELLARGCNLTYDSVDENAATTEVVARTIWERMRSGRFKVEKRLSEWRDEYKTFQRTGAKIPIETHPLMAATRHAVASMEYAKAKAVVKTKQTTYPQIAVI